ncbi:MAG: hypothetical protein LBT19_00355 [Candidatus Nomurabacteria bacterium]|jgi:hypothetical protein|nr:hypothetical protein [Candidatus Nomurabacteria bacterium]
MAEYDTDGSNALASNDPYRGMNRSDIRPNLKVIEGGKKPGSDNARDDLSSVENRAAADMSSVVKGGTNEAKSVEQNQVFNPRFTGEGLPGENKGKKKGKGFLKGRGPLVAIVALLLGGGGLMLGSQTLMPFATANRIIQEFNSMKTVMNRRSDRVLRFQMDTSRYKSPTRNTIFGNDKLKISTKQATKLRTEGINYIELDDVGGRRVRLLTFDDGSGVRQPILSNSDMGKVDSDALISRLKTEMPDVEFSPKTLSIDSAFEIDGFKNGYMSSSKTWRGNIAGWFDSLVLKIFDRLGISRSRFKRWKAASDAEAGNADFKKLAANANADTDKGTAVLGQETVDGEDGPETKPITESDADQDRIRPGDSQDVVETKLGNKAKAVAKVASGAAMAANVTCAVMAAAGAINAIAIASETAQVINYVTGYLEAIQKVQAGDGDGSPMTYYTSALTQPDTNGKTGMGASGISSLFGAGNIDVNNEGVQKYNLENSITLIGKSLKYTIDEMLACSYARFAAGLVGAAADVIMLVGTFGVGNIVKGLASIVWGVLISAAVSFGISTLVSLVIPQVAKMITRDLINGVVGEDLGTAVRVGANMYLGKNHQGGGGSPGDAATVLAYRRETEAILAEEAEYDRLYRSPFDTSSSNTFLGSLLYSLIPLANSVSSVGFVSNLGLLTQNSVVALLPSASAVGDTQMITQQGNCPTLDAVGVMGDAYCVPYFTSDLSTIDGDPGEDIFERVAGYNMGTVTKGSRLNSAEGNSCRHGNETTGYYWEYNAPSNFKYLNQNDDDPKGCTLDIDLDEDSNPKINLDSELGKYIVFCGQRESQFGVADGNITAAFKLSSGNGKLDSVISGGLSAIPGIGGIIDAVDAAQDNRNAPWIGGAACVASSKNEKWGEMSYYQRYAEDQRLIEESGIIKKSGVTIALEEYYEDNPIDQSYEGVLARYSGLTKDEVIATLDLIDYANFVAEYEPAGLYPVPIDDEEVSYADYIPDGIIADHSEVLVVQYVTYTDVRNRNYAV